jgi:hypothetical protein
VYSKGLIIMTKPLTLEQKEAKKAAKFDPETTKALAEITPDEEGLRRAMKMLIPFATKMACGGSSPWAKYLLSMAEKYLPEWKEKSKSVLTPDDFNELHCNISKSNNTEELDTEGLLADEKDENK